MTTRSIGTLKPQAESDLVISSSFPTIAIEYADLDALRSALGTAGVFQEYGLPDSGGPIPFRFRHGITSTGDADDVIAERCYRVVPAAMGPSGVLLELLYSASWTLHSSTSAVRMSHKHPDAVTLTDTGLSQALTGQPIRAVSQDPACICAADPGNAKGYVRVFQSADTTNVLPNSQVEA